jgi:TM2 domain-containing membrane protein YozV
MEGNLILVLFALIGWLMMLLIMVYIGRIKFYMQKLYEKFYLGKEQQK